MSVTVSRALYRTATRFAAAIVAVLLSAGPVAAVYVDDIYNSANDKPQHKKCWCVVGSAKTWLNYIYSNNVYQSTIDDFLAGSPRHDKFDWTTTPAPYQQCDDQSYAHDARGMAWALYQYRPGGQTLGYNDYVTTSQSGQNWRLVHGIRATGKPVGAIVKAGKHAVLVVGYRTDYDPFSEMPQTLYEFNVFDPWYGAGFGSLGWTHYPSGGYAGDAYIAIDYWNTYTFKPDTTETGPEDTQNYYVDKYVNVLMTTTNEPPDDTPPQDYGTYQYEQHIGLRTLLSSDQPRNDAVTPVGSTVERAIREGVAFHNLDEFLGLRASVTSYSVGTTNDVASVVRELPPFVLAEIVINGKVPAIALVTRSVDGFRLGAILRTRNDFRLPRPEELEKILASNGLHGPATLAWTWTDQYTPEGVPAVVGLDGRGDSVYVTLEGLRASLDAVGGVTPLPADD